LFGRSQGLRWAAAVGVAAIALGAASACTSSGSASPPLHSPSAAATPSAVSSPPPPSPAALAGGACLLLNYATVAAQVGTTFTVAAAADSSGTYSCVLQKASGTYPSLTLSITATDLSPADFGATVTPKGASSVGGLGKVGYEQQVAASKSAGPAVEVGWLSGNDRLIVFRYVTPPGTSTAAAKALGPKMISLAKIVDRTTV
jgi:hypothetical protein